MDGRCAKNIQRCGRVPPFTETGGRIVRLQLIESRDNYVCVTGGEGYLILL